MPREKQRHWCRCRMKSQAGWDERQDRNQMRWRCVHAQNWCNVSKRNDQPRERRHTPPPSVSPVPLLCVLCPALSCSLCAVLSCPQQRTMSSVPFYPTTDECSESLKNVTRSRSEASPTASGREPRCNETITPLSALEFRTVQSALTGRLQPRPSTDMVMRPSSVRTGRLSDEVPVFTNEPLQFEATTITRAHHPRVLHYDQDQRGTFQELRKVAARLTERRLRRARRLRCGPRSPPSSTPPEVCLETMDFDFRRRHGTTTTHAAHSSP